MHSSESDAGGVSCCRIRTLRHGPAPRSTGLEATRRGRTANFFGAHNLLSGLPREYSSRLMAKAHAVSLEKGKTLFEIGAAGDGCYWLEEGVLKVSIASPQGAERILAILGAGSIVGELAMLDGLPRSATVQALRDCRLTFLARSVFLEILREHPEIYRHLLAILVERLRQADDEVAAASFLSSRPASHAPCFSLPNTWEQSSRPPPRRSACRRRSTRTARRCL